MHGFHAKTAKQKFDKNILFWKLIEIRFSHQFYSKVLAFELNNKVVLYFNSKLIQYNYTIRRVLLGQKELLDQFVFYFKVRKKYSIIANGEFI